MARKGDLYRVAEKELPTELKILYNLIKTDLDANFHKIYQRLDKIDQRLDRIESDIIYLKEIGSDTKERVTRLESKDRGNHGKV